MQDKAISLTASEQSIIIQKEFDGDENLAFAVGAYCRASLAGRSYAKRNVEAEACFTAYNERSNGTIRTYECVADYEGLIAIYILSRDGRLIRLKNWPQWLVEQDRSPKRRAELRRLQANSRRRWRRSRARLNQIFDNPANSPSQLFSKAVYSPPAEINDNKNVNQDTNMSSKKTTRWAAR